MKINWGLRLKSKKYWLTVVVPVAVVIIGSLLSGVDSNQLTTQLTAIVTGVFGLVSYLGGTIDPTTAGLSDSNQALNYTAKLSKKKFEDENKLYKQQIAELQIALEAKEAKEGEANG